MLAPLIVWPLVVCLLVGLAFLCAALLCLPFSAALFLFGCSCASFLLGLSWAPLFWLPFSFCSPFCAFALPLLSLLFPLLLCGLWTSFCFVALGSSGAAFLLAALFRASFPSPLFLCLPFPALPRPFPSASASGFPRSCSAFACSRFFWGVFVFCLLSMHYF